jgi:hypothetical protein
MDSSHNKWRLLLDPTDGDCTIRYFLLKMHIRTTGIIVKIIKHYSDPPIGAHDMEQVERLLLM